MAQVLLLRVARVLHDDVGLVAAEVVAEAHLGHHLLLVALLDAGLALAHEVPQHALLRLRVDPDQEGVVFQVLLLDGLGVKYRDGGVCVNRILLSLWR